MKLWCLLARIPGGIEVGLRALGAREHEGLRRVVGTVSPICEELRELGGKRRVSCRLITKSNDTHTRVRLDEYTGIKEASRKS